jgi:hypothetical protein
MTIRSRTCLLLGAVLVLVTGCQQAGKNAAAPAPATSSESATAPSTSEPVSSPPASSSSRPSSSVPHTPGTPTSRPPATSPAGTATATRPASIEPGGCPTSALAVAALRASGAAGHQYAFLQFTNRSAKACSLTGYPGVQLVRAGAAFGKPATRSGLPISTVQIAPGKAVTARLVDASTCNADNSDSVAIYPPNRTEQVVVHLSLRGCPLTIDPVVAG